MLSCPGERSQARIQRARRWTSGHEDEPSGEWPLNKLQEHPSNTMIIIFFFVRLGSSSINGPASINWPDSLQAALKADDILNSWPEDEVGRILREYGEESNWRLLQKKIMSARLHGGLHSTKELADLVRSCSPKSKGTPSMILLGS